MREFPFPPELVLTPVSRRPTVLEGSTLRTILDRPVPAFAVGADEQPEVSVVAVTRDNLPFLRLCLESMLAGTERPCELIVVDNASTDGTPAYLAQLAERNPNVRLIDNETNHGFAAACNQGAAVAAETFSCFSTTTPQSPTGGWDGLRRTLKVPGSGWSAQPRIGPATKPRSTPTTERGPS